MNTFPRPEPPLAFTNISTAMKPQALHLCHVLEVNVGISLSIRAPNGMQLKLTD